MIKFLIPFIFLTANVFAALPPASSKGSGEASYSTTFKTNYGSIPVTRSGTTVTLGTPPLATTVTTIPALSGEVSNTGNAVTLDNSSVLGKVLTGFTSGAGTVTGTDSLLQAIQKLNGNDALDKTVSTKAQDSTAVSTSQIQTPYNQLTTTAAGERLIETGNANVLADPGAEATTTPWSAYKDAAGVLPVNGVTDGAAPSYITCANSATSPLAGTKSFLITKISANNAQGEGCSIPFTIPTSSIYKVNRLSFDYAIASGTYADDEIEWFVYDVTNGGTPKPFTPSKLKNHSLPSETFAPNGEFQASDSTSYRLIAHVASTSSAGAWALKFDNFKLGVFEKTYGRGDTEYSAQVSNAGVVSGENRDFISGNCAVTSTNKFTCTYVGGLVTQSMNCQVKEQAVPQTGFFSTLVDNTASTSAQLVYSTYTGTSAPLTAEARAVNVFCQKSGTDYANASGLVMSNDADTRVVNFVGAKTATQNVTANVTDVTFNSLKDSHSCWDGSRCVIKVPGDYIISVMLTNATSTTMTVGVFVNTSFFKYIFTSVSGYRASGTLTIPDLKAGDAVSVRSANSVTPLDADGNISITKISGPSQIMASESVYFTANTSTTAATTSAPFIYSVVTENSHGAYSASTGKFTSPSNRIYHCEATALSSSDFTLYFYKNGTQIVTGWKTYTGTQVAGVFYTTRLLQGETIEVRPGASVTASGGAINNTFSCFSTGI